jgi:leucyl aminopeptidase
MDVKVIPGHIHESDADAIILPFIQDSQLDGAIKQVDQALGGAITDLIDSGDFVGKVGQVSVLYPRGAVPAKRVILIGLGVAGSYSIDSIRRAAATAIKKAGELKASRVATVIYNLEQTEGVVEAITEGSLLAIYNYPGQKKVAAPEVFPKTLEVLVDPAQVEAAQSGVEAGVAIAEGVITARDLVNQPPNVCTPAYMAEIAGKIAKAVGLRCEVLEKKQMEALGMGALLNVARGSDTPPRFIILEHNAERAEELDTIVLIGKGVTFDTGGYSIKTSEGMVGMKADMAGGAAVIGAMQAIAALKLPLHVVGLVPAADNMISGHSYRPQEVITASNGVTIEVISTDAEGRLLLADALVFASRYKPSAVVDIATLTGACVVALGSVAAGLFSSDEALRDALMDASARTGEKVWPLPMFAEYDKDIESQSADIKNSGGRYGGASIGAVFLKHFVDYPAWAHIDMAGLAGIDSMSGKNDNPYVSAKGATGFGTRLLTDFVRKWRKS